jgi:hypothetical protein
MGRDYLADLVISGRTVLKLVLLMYDVKMWSGFD